MIRFYIEKIKNKEINDKTGENWDVKDVPKLWRSKVEAALKEELHD